MKRPRKPDELCVSLDEISGSGHHLSCRKHPGWVAESLHEEKSIDCGFAEDIRIEIDFFKTGKTIIVRGTLATTLQLRCVRCVEDFTLPLAAVFNYNLLPEEERELPQEMEIPREEFEASYYSGMLIDLAPLVLEQIVLHIPMHPLCRDSCRGICQHCGADLNPAPCRCADDEGTVSPFSALRNFTPRQKT